MNRRLLSICIAGMIYWVSPVSAQEAAAPAAPASPWKKKLVASVNFTQAAFDNWSQGGESSLAWQLAINGELKRSDARTDFVNKGRVKFGLSRVGDTGTRKSADEIRLESVLTWKRNRYVNPFVSASAQTQFASGFKYGTNTKTKVSQFLDPGYFTQSAGIGYNPNETVTTRLGATLKETVTRDFPSPYADDPSTPEVEKVRFQGGVTSATELEWKIEKDAVLTSRLELFSTLSAFDEIDMTWENLLTLKVTSLINVSFSVDLVYDKDVTDELQLKEILAVGLSYSFL